MAQRAFGRRRVLVTGGAGSQLVFKPLPQDDPMQRKPDISRAREQLGWQPTIELDEGLDRTIAYFRTVVSGV